MLGSRCEWPALNTVDVEPAVAVEIQERETAAERLGQLVEDCLGVVIDESQAGGLGIVGERYSADGRCAPFRAILACHERETWPRLIVRGELAVSLGVEPIELGQGLSGPAVVRIGCKCPCVQSTGLDLAAGGIRQPSQLVTLGRSAERLLAP